MSDIPTPEVVLTHDERFYIARKLLERAGSKTKDLQQAIANEAHPQLIAQIRVEVTECAQLALKLQGVST